MKLSNRPTFFALSGEYIALLPMPTGGLRLVKHGFRPISAFLRHGSVVPFDNLPTQFRARVLEAWLHRSPTLMH